MPSLRLDSLIRDVAFRRRARGARRRSRPSWMARPALKGGQLVRALQGGDVAGDSGRGRGRAGSLLSVRFAGTVLGLFPLPARPGGTRVRADPRRSSGSRGRSIAAGWKCATSRAINRRSWSLPRKTCGSISRRWDGRVLLVREFDLSGPRPAAGFVADPMGPGPAGCLLIHRGDSSILDQLGGVVAVSRSVPSGQPWSGV